MLCVGDPASFQAGDRRADPGFVATPLNHDLAQRERFLHPTKLILENRVCFNELKYTDPFAT
jgi:hypothetical protein